MYMLLINKALKMSYWSLVVDSCFLLNWGIFKGSDGEYFIFLGDVISQRETRT